MPVLLSSYLTAGYGSHQRHPARRGQADPLGKPSQGHHTPLSLQPLEEGNDGSEKLQEYLNYEGTWENHTPQEREQMTCISQGQVRFAFTREELYCTADFSHEFLKSDKFIGYTPENFAALQWMHHSAWRRFFLGEGTALIEYLVVQVKMGMKLPSENMPAKLRVTFRMPRSGPPGGGNPGGGNPCRPGLSDDGAQQPKKKTKKSTSGTSFASVFAAEIKRGNENTKEGFTLSGKALCPNERALMELLGPEFMALVPDGAKPCLRHYLFGSCMYGKRCAYNHKLCSEPSAAILEGIKVHLMARVDALIARYPKD